MQTPRLCIDTRAGKDFPVSGLLAQEVVDQLVAAAGETDAGSEWIERKRVVLLAHPDQVFSGQLKRHDTRLGLSRTPWHWLRQRHFFRNANITLMHEIKPVDRLSSSFGIPTITTLLPARGRLPFFLSRRPEHHYLVPSERDALLLEKKYLVAREQITKSVPAARRFVHFTVQPQRRGEGGLLILTGGPLAPGMQKKLLKVMSENYPRLPRRVISLRRTQDMTPNQWRKILEETRVVMYLNAPAFDWAPLALESIYWGRPTIFLDDHHALSELLPTSQLRLNPFLIAKPELEEMEKMAEVDRATLEKAGCFEPFAYARAYRDAYLRYS